MISDLSLLLHAISPSSSLSNAQVLGIPSSHTSKGEGDCFWKNNVLQANRIPDAIGYFLEFIFQTHIIDINILIK